MGKIPGWHFDWLRTWDEVWDARFVAQWEGWIGSAPHAHVFFEPSMVRAWVEWFQTRERVDPRFLVAEHASGCRVLFPLVCVRYGWKEGWCRVLQPAGADEVDYHDPIVTAHDGNEGFPSFWNAFCEEIETSVGQEVDDVLVPRVRESCAGSCPGFHEVSRAPFIDLQDVTSIDAVLASGPKSVRQDVRRQIRRLEALGSVTLRIYGRDELDAAREAFEGLLDAYRRRWGGGKKVGDFWRKMLAACLPGGFLHVSVLESHGTPVSWHMGFLHKERFYYYKPSYDAQFAAYSPGKVHLMKLLEESLRQGVHVFDFLRGEEIYKTHWAKQSIALHRLQLEGARFRSRFTRAARKVLWANRTRVRRLLQHRYRTR